MTIVQKLDPERLKSSEFWEDAWFQAKENSIFKKKNKTMQDIVKHWNKRAENFTENVMSEKGKGRINKVIQWLEVQGVKLEGAKVLDIGAGPGPFSLAFAQKVEQVVALEPAENMAAFLKEKIQEGKITNIEVIQDTWEEIDLEANGLKGQFDLVFASMTPGINNWETIHKALQCSKKYCFISQFAGKRQSSIMEDLWQAVYGEEIPKWPAHVMFILNLLYSRGYQLEFSVWEEKREIETTVEEAVPFFINELQMFGKEEPYPEDSVRKFLEGRVQNGKLSHQMVSRLGKILIRL
ncbi:class I SAM-dependent methyltransferase [Candidatus Contubernalis alkaliaceticus]|uniref:class I SAM-dependent methyltransferase n=1 Tax=Candidatus Contubernalis alkaliaceticus TaxID=338645 RepID=UPI001F4BEA81|nr:class I SAM-dependent methyltransferase [Candidatus Contubernalis alkalaceticus]UNC93022.1 class I SAM-dependent methyltransferase [Candidatus Contubernalis alkalaceticus]